MYFDICKSDRQIEKREDLHITRSPDFYGLLYLVSYLYTFALLFPNFAFLFVLFEFDLYRYLYCFSKSKCFSLKCMECIYHTYIYVNKLFAILIRKCLRQDVPAIMFMMRFLFRCVSNMSFPRLVFLLLKIHNANT